MRADTGNLRATVLPPDDLIIGDYALKVNISTECAYKFYILQSVHRVPESLSDSLNKKAGITRLFSYSCLRGFLRVIYNGIAQSTAYKKHASAPQPYRNASGLLSK
ncbi:hypothetical protein HRV96_26885 (plasmid) [Raoultella ornithinolytica]|nr:hypothetical protein HRV96_26885 [Raoultella ornithinolytica]